MASVTLRNVGKSYGNVHISKDINLDIEEGEFVVFVGPSGCGKSTLLRMIAGLEDITTGELYIGDKLMNDVPPAKRGIGMVFQSYALYPHLDVAENMSFGLKLAGVNKTNRDQRVNQVAEILQLAHLLERKPKALSGGQRQRVAIGRTLVSQPEVFLLDEPLSNLDAKLRVDLRKELKRLQKDFKITTLYVTHDQEEALTLSDRIAVFDNGKIEQVGTPSEVYNASQTEFVCDFIGDNNRLDEGTMLMLSQSSGHTFKDKAGYIRLERVRFNRDYPNDVETKGVVLDMEFDGILLKYTVKLTNGKHIHIIDKNDGFSKREIGSEISVFMNPADILQF